MKNLKIIKNIIPSNFKYKSILLLFLFFFTSILEIIGLSMFLPLLSELTNVDLRIISNFKEYLINIYPYLKEKNWTLIIVSSIVLIFFIKNLTLAYISFFRNKYIQDLTISLSSKLLEIYLKQEYLFHKLNNSSKLIRNINLEISTFIVFLTNILSLISEIIFVSGITIFLLVFNPIITIIVILIFLIIPFFYDLFTKNKLLKLGYARYKYSNIAIKNLQQSLGGVKEIKIANLENTFTKIYNLTCKKIAYSVSLYSTLSELPRLIFEFFVIFLACLLVLFSLDNFNSSYILTLLGVYSIIAVKMIPSVVKIYKSIQSANFTFHSVNSLNKEINRKYQKENNNKINDHEKYFFKKLEFKHVHFKYPGSKYSALKKVSLQISKGEKIGIVGESGTGKSTLVDLLMGLIEPTKGKILVDKNNLKMIKRSWQNAIGYVPQNIYLMDNSILKNLSLFKNGIPDIKLIKKVLKITNLNKTINNMAKGLNTTIGERGDKLSAGQKQRIGIARALYIQPQILILDEPTSALDGENEKKIIEQILNIKNITLIVITHKPEILKKFDKIIFIKNGQIKKLH